LGYKPKSRHNELIPGPKKPFTRHQQAIGGSKMTLAKKLGSRYYCNNTCAIYPCYNQPLSEDNPDAKYKYQRKICAMKRLSPRLRQRWVRLYLEGHEGLLEELRDTLLSMREHVNNDRAAQDLALYFDKLERIADRLYPERKPKEGLEVSGTIQHEHTITLTRIVEEFQVIEAKKQGLLPAGEGSDARGTDNQGERERPSGDTGGRADGERDSGDAEAEAEVEP